CPRQTLGGAAHALGSAETKTHETLWRQAFEGIALHEPLSITPALGSEEESCELLRPHGRTRCDDLILPVQVWNRLRNSGARRLGDRRDTEIEWPLGWQRSKSDSGARRSVAADDSGLRRGVSHLIVFGRARHGRLNDRLRCP